MDYRKLGHSDIDVSVICLGTMTWGEQNTPEQAFEQMDYAVSQGVNFFDTAELYAIPPRAETPTHSAAPSSPRRQSCRSEPASIWAHSATSPVPMSIR